MADPKLDNSDAVQHYEKCFTIQRHLDMLIPLLERA